MEETKTYLPSEVKKAAKKVAKEQGVSLATYLRLLVLRDTAIKNCLNA